MNTDRISEQGFKWLPLGYAAGIVVLFESLYGGMFASNDVAVYTRAASGIIQSGGIFGPEAYSNGFAYPALVSTLSLLTGLSVATLQLYILPVALLFTTGAAIVFFSRSLGTRGTVLASLLLLMHPFLLFSAYRSTHEKFTYALILLTSYALYQTFASSSNEARTKNIILSYIMMFGLITQNAFFAAAFISAIGITLVITELTAVIGKQKLRTRRLAYTVTNSFVLLLIMMYTLYPPASRSLSNVGSAAVRGFLLLIGASPSGESQSVTGAAVYQTALTSWSNPEVWFLLTSFYWIVFPVAGITWLFKVKGMVLNDKFEESNSGEIFFLVLFATFSSELAITVLLDQLGLYFGANTQIRILPLVGIFAVFFAVVGTMTIYKNIQLTFVSVNPLPVDISQIFCVVVIILLFTFAGTSALKASNNPLVSNNWTFASDGEMRAIEWIEGEAADQIIWTGYRNRVISGHTIRNPSNRRQNTLDISGANFGLNYVLWSETLSALSQSTGLPLPPRDNANLVYTNGDARLFWFEEFHPMKEFNRALAEAT